MTENATEHRRGFHGPMCWALSIGAGVLLGLALAYLFPAGAGSAHASDPRAPRIKEILPDGTALERLRSGHTIPWRETQPAEPDAGAAPGPHAGAPDIPITLCIPFALLLGAIAVMPFVSRRFWHRHYPDVALLLGALVAAYYLAAFGAHGRHAVLHTTLEYYGFIALVGGLYVVSGGILLDIRTRATPLTNTALLAVGAVLANIVGTTGASVLLIRPFMRMNRGRLRARHVVFFIFIVSNCGGCLTPIGDPPLYLGFLRGVPFFWTAQHLWPMWLLCVGMLLVIFYLVDVQVGPARLDHLPPEAEHAPVPGARPERLELFHSAGFDPHHKPLLVVGGAAGVCLLLMVAAVFLDPALERLLGVTGFPYGATAQVLIAVAAYFLARPSVHHANAFTFEPVKEVGLLFAGIFLTMIPALGYLEAHGGRLGLEAPSEFYYGTGTLSAVLDNAPTYLAFLQGALGVLHLPLDPAGIDRFIHNTYEVVRADGSAVHFDGGALLTAISLGAVFFGAMTYIGNGPNFMVKSIAESSGLRMPSFFGYLGLATLILLPVLVVVRLIFIH